MVGQGRTLNFLGLVVAAAFACHVVQAAVEKADDDGAESAGGEKRRSGLRSVKEETRPNLRKARADSDESDGGFAVGGSDWDSRSNEDGGGFFFSSLASRKNIRRKPKKQRGAKKGSRLQKQPLSGEKEASKEKDTKVRDGNDDKVTKARIEAEPPKKGAEGADVAKVEAKDGSHRKETTDNAVPPVASPTVVAPPPAASGSPLSQAAGSEAPTPASGSLASAGSPGSGSVPSSGSPQSGSPNPAPSKTGSPSPPAQAQQQETHPVELPPILASEVFNPGQQRLPLHPFLHHIFGPPLLFMEQHHGGDDSNHQRQHGNRHVEGDVLPATPSRYRQRQPGGVHTSHHQQGQQGNQKQDPKQLKVCCIIGQINEKLKQLNNSEARPNASNTSNPEPCPELEKKNAKFAVDPLRELSKTVLQLADVVVQMKHSQDAQELHIAALEHTVQQLKHELAWLHQRQQSPKASQGSDVPVELEDAKKGATPVTPAPTSPSNDQQKTTPETPAPTPATVNAGSTTTPQPQPPVKAQVEGSAVGSPSRQQQQGSGSAQRPQGSQQAKASPSQGSKQGSAQASRPSHKAAHGSPQGEALPPIVVVANNGKFQLQQPAKAHANHPGSPSQPNAQQAGSAAGQRKPDPQQILTQSVNLHSIPRRNVGGQ